MKHRERFWTANGRKVRRSSARFTYVSGNKGSGSLKSLTQANPEPATSDGLEAKSNPASAMASIRSKFVE